MNFKKNQLVYVIGCALMVVLTPLWAATIGQVDVSSEEGDLLILDDDLLVHTGKGAAIGVSGKQNGFIGSAMDIRVTAAGANDSVTGLQVVGGGQGSLITSTIRFSGAYGSGASASGEGSHLYLEQTDISTTGGRGVMITKGASATFIGGNVITTGPRAYAVIAEGAGSIISIADTSLSTSGYSADAVRAQDGAHIAVKNTSLMAHGQSAAGIFMTGVDTVVSVDGTTVDSDWAQGVDLQEGLLQFSNGTIKAKTDGIRIRPSTPTGAGRAEVSKSQILSQSGYGVNVNADGSSVELIDSHIITQGDYGSAIWMPGASSQADVHNSLLETWGTEAAAIDNRAGAFRMNGGGVVTHGDSSHALYASTDGPGHPNATLHLQNVAVETFGKGSVGAYARLANAHVSLVDSQILTHGDFSHGLLVSGSGASILALRTNVITEGNSGYGLFASNNATVSIQGSQIQTHGDDAYGLVSTATAAGVTNQIDLIDSTVFAQNSNVLRVSGGSLLTHLTNSSLIGHDTERSSTAVWITDGADGVAAGLVTLDSNQSLIDGNILVDGGAMQLSLQNQSRLQGLIADTRLTSSFSLDDSSSWLMRGSSSIGQLESSGTVEFAEPVGGDFMRLNVAGNLAGNGYYIMNTDLGSMRGDRLDVGGQVIGNNQVLVRNSGAEPPSDVQRLTLVNSQGGTGDFSLANHGQVVDVGTYRYTLQREDSAGGNSQWNLVNTGEHLSTAASAAINSSALATLRDTWDAERGSLIQRLGDVRAAGQSEGAWMRSYGQKQELNNGATRHFSQNVNGMQWGLDTRLAQRHGSLILGGLAGYSHVNRDFNSEGSGKLESYYIGTYATYVDDAGWYADSLLTLNHWSTRFDVTATDGERVSGKTRSSGAGLSFETGKRFSLDSGWFVEPQAQLSALYGGSDRYRLSNGLSVKADAGIVPQLRGGALLGRALALDNGATVQSYIKAGWTQDLRARSQIRTNGISNHPDGNGGGWYAGAGITGSQSRGQNLYAEVETSDSSTLKRPWSLNIGYRLAW